MLMLRCSIGCRKPMSRIAEKPTRGSPTQAAAFFFHHCRCRRERTARSFCEHLLCQVERLMLPANPIAKRDCGLPCLSQTIQNSIHLRSLGGSPDHHRRCSGEGTRSAARIQAVAGALFAGQFRHARCHQNKRYRVENHCRIRLELDGAALTTHDHEQGDRQCRRQRKRYGTCEDRSGRHHRFYFVVVDNA